MSEASVYRHKWVQSVVELRRRLHKSPGSSPQIEFLDFAELPKEWGQFIVSVKRIDGFTSLERKELGSTSRTERGLGLKAFGLRTRCGVLRSHARTMDIASEVFHANDAGVLVIAVADPAATSDASELTLRTGVAMSYSQSDRAPNHYSHTKIFSSPTVTLQELYEKQPLMRFPVSKKNKHVTDALEFEYEMFFALKHDPHVIYPHSMKPTIDTLNLIPAQPSSSPASPSNFSKPPSEPAPSAPPPACLSSPPESYPLRIPARPSKSLAPAAAPPPPQRRPVGFTKSGYSAQAVLDMLLESAADWLEAHPDFAARPYAIKHALTQRDGLFTVTLFYHPRG